MPDRRRGWLAVALVLVAAAAFWAATRDRALLNPGGLPILVRFLGAAASPERDPAFLAHTLRAAITTVAFATCGTALSLALGAVGGALGATVTWRTLGAIRPQRIAGAVRAALALPRSLHEMVWGLLLVAVLGLDPVTGIVAIAIPFGATTARVFSLLLDERPPGPVDALSAAGARPLAALVYGLWEVVPELLSYAFYRFECALRSAVVLGIVGAGGLGFEIALSLQSLRFEQVWTLLYALIVLNGATDAWSALVRRRLGRASTLELVPGDARRPARANGVLRGSIAVAATLLVVSIAWLGPSFGRLVSERTIGLALDLGRRSWPPTLPPPTTLLGAVADTLAMSVLATAVAGVLGAGLSFVAARTTEHRVAGAAVRLALLLLRSVSAPVWALVLLFVVFPGITAGAAALGLYTLGVLGRLMAEVVEETDRAPVLALRTAGAGPVAATAYGVAPLVAGRFAAFLVYRWEVCVRATAMVGIVGATGLGRILQDSVAAFDHRGVAGTLVVYAALTVAVDAVGDRARRDLGPRSSDDSRGRSGRR